MMKKILLFFKLFVLVLTVFGQSLSLDLSYLSETQRRLQVLGISESKSSFSMLPMDYSAFAVSDSVLGQPIEPAWTGYSLFKGLMKTDLKVLSPSLRVQFNSHHPYPVNDGAIKPAKGLSTLTTAGVAVKNRFLSLQLRPSFLAMENLPYEGFPESHFPVIWNRRYLFWNRIDNPESFGTEPIKEIGWGQSHALLLVTPQIGLGISTENLWWGPGKRNSLLMSNNAAGFAHLTLKTVKPIETPIGSFEGQLIGGRLDPSGYRPPVYDISYRNNGRFYTPKVDDWRYLNALTLNYSPKWIHGLSLGVIRSIQVYSQFAKDSKTYFPVFINLFRKNDGSRDERQIDQLISIFGRWVWEDAQTELYFEFGRNDASLHLRDFLLSPQHSRAYIFGFSKLFTLKRNYLEVNYEHTEMAQTTNYIIRNALSWYIHGIVRHGYTHEGEVLGATIGPGSNMDHVSVSYIMGLKKLGFVFERISHQNDFYYLAWSDINDFRRFWIDYTFGATYAWDFKSFVVSGDLLYTRSMNYQWETDDPLIANFVPGRDVSNVYFSLNFTYLF